MLEIFALPYILVSGVIGWAVFGPFVQVNDSDSLSFANVTISDLLAMPLPFSAVFATASWIMPVRIEAFPAQAFVMAIALGFAAMALSIGLLLVPKTIPISFFKRLTIVGIISPIGLVLTCGWVGFLVWACIVSVWYFVPSMIVIAVGTLGLRIVALWACKAG